LQDASAFCKDLKPFLFYSGINKLIILLENERQYTVGTDSSDIVRKNKKHDHPDLVEGQMFFISIIKGFRQAQTDKLIELKLMTAPT
jgi:hypothetical protein